MKWWVNGSKQSSRLQVVVTTYVAVLVYITYNTKLPVRTDGRTYIWYGMAWQEKRIIKLKAQAKTKEEKDERRGMYDIQVFGLFGCVSVTGWMGG